MIEFEPMDEGQIESIARDAVSDAIDFIESEVAEDRIKAQRYFDGEVDLGHEEGRSRIVSTKVRDTIRNIKPSLMRVFLSNDQFVQFVPASTEDVEAAETATKFVHSQFSEKNGYRVISDVFHDALLKKAGIVKVYWDEYAKQSTHEYTNLTDPEFTLLGQEDDVDIIEHEVVYEVQMDEIGMEIQIPFHNAKIVRTKTEGTLRCDSVPPEEFFIDRNAKSIDDFYVCGHRTEMRAGDLIAMGYDPDIVSSLSGISDHDTMAEAEDFERRGYEQEEDEDIRDPSMRKVAVTEAYMRMDVEGTGTAQLYKITMGGGQYQLLDYEPWDEVPFAVFESDPEPHAFFGRSIADLIIEDQDASTSILRGILDNIAMTNNPRLSMIEGQVNIDDLLNNEIGGIVRMKDPNAVQQLQVPFAAGQVLGAAQYYDQLIESKTGVSKASVGLDPDALQNQTATAARLTASAAAGHIEVIARNLAEGGMTRMFKLMLKLLAENSPEEQMMRLSGGMFAPIDPRSWNTDMMTSVNVGLGTGKEDERLAALQTTFQTQLQFYQTGGPNNGLVSMTNIRNTLADILALTGVRNSDRYYQPMTPEIETQLIQMQQQQMMAAAQGQQDQQAQALVQAETIRAQAKAQSDMAKIQLDAQKALAQDDRERDKMDQDLLIKAAEIIGKYGTAVDVENIRAMQKEQRFADTTPQQAIVQSRF
tara:strand:+ start:7551 stop:9656 length:2106 start_codon:yes stop_codon:yes gene_type:complete